MIDFSVLKNSNLIQNCIFNEENGFNIDMMGAAEFEHSALESSMIRIFCNLDHYEVSPVSFHETKDMNKREMMVLCKKEMATSCSIAALLIVNGEVETKRATYINDYIEGKPKQRLSGDINLWWDIQNDFFMLYENSELFMDYLATQRAMLYPELAPLTSESTGKSRVRYKNKTT